MEEQAPKRGRGRPPGPAKPKPLPPDREAVVQEFEPIREWFAARKWASIVRAVALRAGVEPTSFHKMLEGERRPNQRVVDAVKKVISEELGYHE